jgi:hypothetical protein
MAFAVVVKIRVEVFDPGMTKSDIVSFIEEAVRGYQHTELNCANELPKIFEITEVEEKT